MPQRRRIARIVGIAVTCVTAASLVACSSSTAGEGSTTAPVTPTPAGTSATGTVPNAAGGTSDAPRPNTRPDTGAGTSLPAHAAGLSALMKQGVASIKSAHISLNVSAAGQTITGEGDETMTDGKLDAADITEHIGSVGQMRMIIVGSKVYVKLPSSLNSSGKPWQLASATSSNPVLKQLASTLSSLENSMSLDSTTIFVNAAKSLDLKGKETVNGASAAHYSITVDVTALPSDYPGKTTLVQAGLTTLPVELWIDDKGRPVKMVEKFSVQGQDVSTEVEISKYNVPVKISAPPAGQVSTS